VTHPHTTHNQNAQQHNPTPKQNPKHKHKKPTTPQKPKQQQTKTLTTKKTKPSKKERKILAYPVPAITMLTLKVVMPLILDDTPNVSVAVIT